jgi:hypothetical protein
MTFGNGNRGCSSRLPQARRARQPQEELPEEQPQLRRLREEHQEWPEVWLSALEELRLRQEPE